MIEHTESLIYLLNNAKNQQRGLFVTHFDFQNAFGEVTIISYYPFSNSMA